MNYAGLVSTYRFRESDIDPKLGEPALFYPDGKRRQTNIMRANRICAFRDGSKGPICFVTYTKPGKQKIKADMVVDVLDPKTGEAINQIDCTRAEFEMLPRLGDPDPATESAAELEARRAKRAEARAERARREREARGPAPQDPAPEGPLSVPFNAPTDPPPEPPGPAPAAADAPAAELPGGATLAAAEGPQETPPDPETKTTEPDLPSNTGTEAAQTPPEKEKKGGKSKRGTK